MRRVVTKPPAKRIFQNLYNKLYKLGFKSVYRSRNQMDPHQYNLIEGDTTFIVQIWPDEKHRVSHSHKGYEIVIPTPFSTPEELEEAIKDQRNKIPLTQAHVQKVTSQIPKEEM